MSKGELIPVNVAVMTVSDSRTEETDTSGRALVEKLTGELSGLKNPQDPQAVYVNPRYVEGWTRPHNGWP